MTLRLSDLIVCGELFNTKNYSVHGWVQLRGQEHTLHLELTGNCGPDLAGWHLRFEAPPTADGDAADAIELPDMAWQQVGPTGVMTAARGVLVDPSLPEPRGEPSNGRPCLTLEWFSQNGRVLIELVNPILEFVEFTELKAPTRDIYPLPQQGEAAAAPEVEQLEVHPRPADAAEDVEMVGELLEEDDALSGVVDEEDPYGLFTDGLRQQFDDATLDLERSLRDDEDKPRDVREMELIDELIERGTGDLIGDLIDRPLHMPRPEATDNAKAEEALKAMLAELALYGIALHVCEHFTPRDAYRLMVEEICPKEIGHRELRGTQWVQGFMTSEHCRECEAELEREYQEYDRQRQENPQADDEDLGGEEIPF